jgi:DNA-binding NarL/FixJ family response regulator
MTPPLQPRSSRKIRVLHIDDSAVMRSLLRMVLEPQPSIEIAATASSGQEGLAPFERIRPDLVLLDWHGRPGSPLQHPPQESPRPRHHV